MTLPVSDDFFFNGTESLTIYSSSWSNRQGSLDVSSYEVINNSGSVVSAYWNADTFADNQYASVAFSNPQPGGASGPIVRCATSANTYYAVTMNSNSNSGQLFKYVSSTKTNLGSASGNAANGTVLRLEASGSTLTAKKDGSTSGAPAAQTDSAIASGKAGMYIVGFYYYVSFTCCHLDNFTAGNLSTTYTQTVSGAISNSGALQDQTSKPLAGAITSAGALGRQWGKSLAGNMSSVGVLGRQWRKALTGTVTSAGALGAWSVSKAMTGTISSAGAVQRSLARVLGGTITSAGVVRKSLARSFAGTVSSAGSLLIGLRSYLSLSGAITPSGSIDFVNIFIRAFAGAIDGVGTLGREWRKGFAGAITSVGALGREWQKALSGVIGSAGVLDHGVYFTRILGGGINPAGSVSYTLAFVRAFGGILASAGTLKRQPARVFAGSLSGAGVVARQTAKLLTGVLDSAATLGGAAILYLSGTLSSGGVLTKGGILFRSFGGAIGLVGALNTGVRLWSDVPPLARTFIVGVIGRVTNIATGLRLRSVNRDVRQDEVKHDNT